MIHKGHQYTLGVKKKNQWVLREPKKRDQTNISNIPFII
jgi:hypothetical protein